MNWYYEQSGKQLGPVSDSDLEKLLQTGAIRPDTLVWREGMANWTPYNQAVGGAGSSAAAGNASGSFVCAECGKMFPPDDVIKFGEQFVCATCKPAFMQKVREGVASVGGPLAYAGFWIRFAAYFIDALICGGLGWVVGFVMGAAMQPATNQGMVQLQIASSAAGFILGVIYYVFFNGKFGATPGKMVCGLKIVTAEGFPIGYGRALGRYFAAILSSLICAIGYIMAAFDDEKRTLHDRICNTRVIKK